MDRQLILDRLEFMEWMVRERRRHGVEPSPEEKAKLDALRTQAKEGEGG